MKRGLLFLLITVYLLSCTGIAINSFYCCGKLKSVTVSYGAADKNNKTDHGKGCCRHEEKNLKISDTHYNSTAYSLSKIGGSFIVNPFDSFESFNLVELPIATISRDRCRPPLNQGIAIYTLNCTYRI